MSDFGPPNQHKNRTNLDNSILKYLTKILTIKSLIDVGCGPGWQVTEAHKLGIEAIGIDGDSTLKMYDDKHFFLHDYTTGSFPVKDYDLGWSVEFLEHVYEKYIPNIFSTLRSCKVVCCSHAVPGQKGRHHVNCQTTEYWVDVFHHYGFTYDAIISSEIKKLADSRWLKNTGLFFINRKFLF